MRFPPPEIVATWPEPNYLNPQTRGPELIIVEVITLSVALICLALRMYVRLRVMRTTGWDDWMMVGAALFGAGVTICVVLAFTRFGWENHVWDLQLPDMIAGRQVSFAAQVLFTPATTLAKLSILLSYLRLAPAKSWFRRWTLVAMWCIGLGNVGFLILLCAQCIPTSSYWNLLRNPHDCIPETPGLMSQAIFTVLSDFVVWVLPLPSLYQAKLPLFQRLTLIVLFSFGMVVVVAACFRTYWVHYVLEETYDVTWEGLQLWMWTAVEVQLGIICGCVPWLKSLFKFVKSKHGSTGASGSYGAGTGTKPSGPKTISEGGAVFRMDSVGGKYPTSPRVRELYIDLESCRDSSRSSSPEPGSRPEPGRPGGHTS